LPKPPRRKSRRSLVHPPSQKSDLQTGGKLAAAVPFYW
jgi:hypothetical protein